MPRKIRRSKRNISRAKRQGNFFNRIKISESYTSLILGAIVVLVIGIILISFAKVNRNKLTSSVKDFIPVEKLNLQDSNTSSTYTVRPGDDLWTISVNIYNNGYRWIEIAKLNNMENPGLIQAGEKLMIPVDNSQEQTMRSPTVSPSMSNSEIINNSISGSTYVIQSGDNLWDICVRAYGDGYKWPEIARINHLDNPDLIFSGNVLQLPRQ